jgi:hypothetical protein
VARCSATTPSATTTSTCRCDPTPAHAAGVRWGGGGEVVGGGLLIGQAAASDGRVAHGVYERRQEISTAE